MAEVGGNKLPSREPVVHELLAERIQRAARLVDQPEPQEERV